MSNQDQSHLINVITEINYNNKEIRQFIESQSPGLDNGLGFDDKVKRIIKTQDEGIKEALIRLGWIPPEDHLKIEDVFSEIYLTNKYEDKHQELANRLGISRTDAKVECYRFMFNSQFIQTHIDNAKGMK